jgi:hypothetical protein
MADERVEHCNIHIVFCAMQIGRELHIDTSINADNTVLERSIIILRKWVRRPVTNAVPQEDCETRKSVRRRSARRNGGV